MILVSQWISKHPEPILSLVMLGHLVKGANSDDSYEDGEDSEDSLRNTVWGHLEGAARVSTLLS